MNIRVALLLIVTLALAAGALAILHDDSLLPRVAQRSVPTATMTPAMRAQARAPSPATKRAEAKPPQPESTPAVTAEQPKADEAEIARAQATEPAPAIAPAPAEDKQPAVAAKPATKQTPVVVSAPLKPETQVATTPSAEQPASVVTTPAPDNENLAAINPTEKRPAPVVSAPPPAPEKPAVAEPQQKKTTPAVTAPMPQTDSPAVVATAPASAPVVTEPTPLEKPIIVEAPLPEKRPDTSKAALEKHRPANYLFGAKQLPSKGRARAIGYYPKGCLAGGVELPVDGPNWQAMRLSRNRNWGHPELVRFLERFAPAAAKATGWPGVLIGDMSQPRGGPTPFGHRSHQTGLDVDIWFMPMPKQRLSRKQREKISATHLVESNGKKLNPKIWTPETADFIRVAAERPEVERVLVNAAIKKELCRLKGKKHWRWMAKVRPWYGHDDHIHVRLKCPADSPHCRSQPAVSGGDGCSKKELAFWFSDRVLHPKPPKHPKPRKQMMLADLPAACKVVLNAPNKKSQLAAEAR